jgi:hypothetical protein
MSHCPTIPPPPPHTHTCTQVMSGTMLQQLQGFNKDTISEEMVELCEVYVSMEDYNLERAKKVAGAVAGLTSWTEAMCTFYWYVTHPIIITQRERTIFNRVANLIHSHTFPHALGFDTLDSLKNHSHIYLHSLLAYTHTHTHTHTLSLSLFLIHTSSGSTRRCCRSKPILLLQR